MPVSQTAGTIHRLTHRVSVAAPAEVVYGLIVDAANWPQVFGPTVHVERQFSGENAELLTIWAVSKGTPRRWRSRRRLFPAERRVTFERIESQPPTESMSGEWVVFETSAGHCEVELRHAFSAFDDAPTDVAWITAATEANSRTELQSLRNAAEAFRESGETTFSFDDEIDIAGPVAAVYGFLYRADLWPERLPHVGRLALLEDVPNIQVMEMDTVSVDGSTHTTHSVRACFPHHKIVYKQTVTPRMMVSHTGHWSLTATATGVHARSRHTVTLDPAAVREVMGPEATLAQARERVRTALGTNSLTTLRHAKAYAEGRIYEAGQL